MATYILLIHLVDTHTTTVGSIGQIEFGSGYYAYIGSARSDSFTRLDRHKEVATGENETTHWHIDYLLSLDDAHISGAFVSEQDIECETAQEMTGVKISQFGCSDCSCGTHLYHEDNLTDLMNTINDLNKSMQYPFKWTLIERKNGCL